MGLPYFTCHRAVPNAALVLHPLSPAGRDDHPNHTRGDGFYGISELQLRGVAIPAPAPVAAIIASGALTLRRRRA